MTKIEKMTTCFNGRVGFAEKAGGVGRRVLGYNKAEGGGAFDVRIGAR